MTPELRAELNALDEPGLEEALEVILARLSELHMAATGEEPIPVIERAGREVVARRTIGGVTLQLEKVKCGKETCRQCPHGPYWYGYWRQGGRMKSQYIGKEWAKVRGFAEQVQAAGRTVGGRSVGDLRS
jgi:hypothetical protein